MALIARYPASHAQRGLWFLHGLAPHSLAYNIVSAWRIKSRLDVGALEAAAVEVLARHDALRTTYRLDGDELWAEVYDGGDALRQVDVDGTGDDVLMRHVAEEVYRPFDLGRGPVFRASLLTRAAADHVLVLAGHHIVADGWSNRIIMKELERLYEARACGAPSRLSPAGASCEEFSRWQAEMLAGPEGERLRTYWHTQLAGGVSTVDLSTDRPRTAVPSHRGAAESLAIGGDLATAVRQLARAQGTTPFVVLLAAFKAFLARYTGQEDIVVGSIAHGRTVPRFRRTVGNLMNQIILRTDLGDQPAFVELVQRVRETVQGALDHQNYPFPLLVEQLVPDRDPRRSLLCDVTFGVTYLVGEGGATLDWGGLQLTALPVPRRTSQCDLDVQLVESPGGMTAVFQYDSDLFDAATIQRMSRYYRRLVGAFCADPSRALWDVPLLDEAERGVLVAGWTSTSVELGGTDHVEALVEAQVDRAPDAVAVAGRGRCLTYRELDQRANQLAHRLRRLGVDRDAPVAICVDRSPDLVVGLLGVLKAGGAYVPLDPLLPAARLAFVIDDAGARAVVTEERFRTLLGDRTIPVVSLDGDAATLAQEPVDGLTAGDGRSGDLAYIIYTSGSSGTPKGVQVEHGGVVNAVQDVVGRLRLGPADVWTAATTVAFDVASLEIWGALAAGARLEIVESGAVADGERLAAAIRDTGATVMLGTPTLWRLLLDSGWRGQPGLKMVSGGERLSRELADALLQRGAELWNQYGPSETTMYVTTELVAQDGSTPSIGHPIRNVRAYVLDARGEPVPVGVAGELSIAGVQVARGYVNRPEETARAFDADPWVPGARRYRTGDLARYHADGRLECLGRLDGQVKIRGHRVELGEIEAVLETHPAVRAAVVLARVTGPHRLTAHLIARDPQALPTPEELRAFLRSRLPDHMVPSDFKLLDTLPLTPSGKVDRRAVASAAGSSLEPGGAELAPRTGLEQTLARIWAEVLERPRVARSDDFFGLGGHSLLATQVVSRIRQTLGIDLPLRELFEAPTVAGLAERIADRVRAGSAAGGPTIERRATSGPAPLSFSQERMWFLHRLAPESAAYNVTAAIRVRGPLNHHALAAALGDIARRHEILRTVFPLVDGRPVQVVTDRPIDMTIVDLQGEPEAQRKTRARDILRAEARRPFDLAQGPVARAHLVRLDAADHICLLNVHHIVCDHWSFGVLGRELIALYNAHVAGRPAPLAPPPIQFADFAAWQRQWLSPSVLEAQLAFWRRHLGGKLPALDLPIDRPRPTVPSYEGRRESRRLPHALVAGVEALSRRERASVFMTLMAAFNGLLARYTGQEDLLLGVPIANRHHFASEGLIGTLVNTLPIRTDVSGDPSFRELLGRVRDGLLDAYAHQEMPFDKLVQELQPERYTSHSPLIQVLVNLPNAPVPRQRFERLTWEPFELDRGAAQFDLTLSFDWGPSSGVSLEYSTDLFERSTAARMLTHFEALLKAVVGDPDRRLSDIPLLRPAERRLLLTTWNRTEAAYPANRCLHELIEAQAQRTPDSVAVEFGEQRLTYRELDARANQLARALISRGAGPEVLVGICLERSLEMVVAVLATLKAGAAYVPLDPMYPQERLALMLDDSDARVLLTQDHLARELPHGRARVLRLDAQRAELARLSVAPVRTAVTPGHRAYVIYTSGSTGRPKGVEVMHRNVVNFLSSMRREPGLTSSDVLLAVTTLSFDIAGLELLLPLTVGARVVIASREVAADGVRLGQLLRTTGASVMQATPATWQMLVDAGWRGQGSLRVLCGGEALSRALADALLDRAAEVWNLYGPTETTIWSTVHRVTRNTGIVPIGRPIDNTTIYILDRADQPVPIGVAGELHIGGAGVARGYLNQPELTAATFVPDPFSDKSGARMYRTGDLARYRSDGTIECLGRLDAQVKIRGYRIELGEIEAALTAHPAVTKAVAVARHDDDGGRRLVGYVVASNGVQAPEILEFVRRRLPGYMVPPALVILDALPLTPNGKVDRRALPVPRMVRREPAERPRTDTERVLTTIWANLLGLSDIGVHDDFFQLGGHSLLATQLMSRIEAVFGTALPLRILFEAPTIASLAALIDASPRAGAPDTPTTGGGRVEIEL